MEEITLECMCGCCKVEITHDKEDNLFYLSAYESSFYARQGKVKQYFTRLWKAIKGEDHNLYELVLNDNNARALRDFIVSKTIDVRYHSFPTDFGKIVTIINEQQKRKDKE